MGLKSEDVKGYVLDLVRNAKAEGKEKITVTVREIATALEAKNRTAQITSALRMVAKPLKGTQVAGPEKGPSSKVAYEFRTSEIKE